MATMFRRASGEYINLDYVTGITGTGVLSWRGSDPYGLNEPLTQPELEDLDRYSDVVVPETRAGVCALCCYADDGTVYRLPILGWRYSPRYDVASPIFCETHAGNEFWLLEFPEPIHPRWVDPENISFDTLDEALVHLREQVRAHEARQAARRGGASPQNAA